jgi:hypothetical protein
MVQVNAKRVALLMAVACLFGAVLGSASTFAVLQRSQRIPTSGIVIGVNVGVFADASATQNMTAISWGSVYPGESIDRTVFVKNTGNAPLTLSMVTANWAPPLAANGSMTVVWNREDAVLSAGQLVAATFTLSVSPDISGVTDFGVNIIVTGSG